MIKLSVIIPNYNKEGYLKPLLEHLKEQLTNEVEVIVIDDASTDSSWDIISEYKDVFKVLKNDINRYNSYTRNVGIDNAVGEYITFMDSDDDIKEDFIETILESIKTNKDGYFFNYTINNVIDGSYIEKGYNTMVWSKVYKRKLIEDKKIRFDVDRFPRGTLSEDLDFNLQVLYYTNNIEVSNKEIIIYNWGITNSVSNSEQSGDCDTRYEIDEKFMERWFK